WGCWGRPARRARPIWSRWWRAIPVRWLGDPPSLKLRRAKGRLLRLAHIYANAGPRLGRAVPQRSLPPHSPSQTGVNALMAGEGEGGGGGPPPPPPPLHPRSFRKTNHRTHIRP